MTPEGRVKLAVKGMIQNFRDVCSVRVFEHWPVPYGMGKRDLDCNLVLLGHAISVETKAPGELPTPAQWLTIEDKMSAGALVLVVADSEDICELRDVMSLMFKLQRTAAVDIAARNIVRYRALYDAKRAAKAARKPRKARARPN